MPYTTRADGDVLTASSHNANCRDQVVSTVTSATRPAGTEGQIIYETDTDTYQAYTGSGWVPFGQLGAWSSYTATINQPGLVAVTLTRARYFKVGRKVTIDLLLDVTGTGTVNNSVVVSLPVTASSSSAATTMGIGHIRDASANAKYYGMAIISSTTSIALLEIAQGTDRHLGATGSAFTAALASGDFVSVLATYEAAA